MMRQSREPAPPAVHVPGYLAIKEAASLLGVSPRSIYGYIESGRLQSFLVGGFTVVSAAEVSGLERRGAGRRREKTPLWHMPPSQNRCYVTTITVNVFPGQQACFEHKLAELRRTGQHVFPGTAARYLTRNQCDPDEITLVLVWREVVMPSEEERDAAITALGAEWMEVLDWDMAVQTHGRVLLHA